MTCVGSKSAFFYALQVHEFTAFKDPSERAACVKASAAAVAAAVAASVAAAASLAAHCADVLRYLLQLALCYAVMFFDIVTSACRLSTQ